MEVIFINGRANFKEKVLTLWEYGSVGPTTWIWMYSKIAKLVREEVAF